MSNGQEEERERERCKIQIAKDVDRGKSDRKCNNCKNNEHVVAQCFCENKKGQRPTS